MDNNLTNNQTPQPTPQPTPEAAPAQPAQQPSAAQVVMGTAPATNQPQQATAQPLGEEKNFSAGIIGAVLGSIIGGAVIALILLAGYYAALGGLVMGLATIGLYKKLAKGISKKGIVVCVVCMLVMTYFAVHTAVAVTILKEYGKLYHIGFGDAFSLVWRLAGVGEFWGLLGLTYLFTGLGAAGAIASEFKNIKK